MLHALILAVIFSGCINCPPNGVIQTNTVTQTIGTNVLGSASVSNGTLVATFNAPSNQVAAVSNAFANASSTNPVPSQITINPQ